MSPKSSAHPYSSVFVYLVLLHKVGVNSVAAARLEVNECGDSNPEQSSCEGLTPKSTKRHLKKKPMELNGGVEYKDDAVSFSRSMHYSCEKY